MYNPTIRLLTILELLQSRSEVSGLELAQKLEVEERSIRRYIMMLRDLGIPIEGERGRHGGYSLRPGFRLPPMMFNKDEITAVMMGLMLMKELGSAANLAVESAIAKIHRVLPDELSVSAEALANTLIFEDVSKGIEKMPSEDLNIFSAAVNDSRCVLIHYASRDGGDTERVIAPYGIVLHGGRWYIPAYCYLRKDLRVFRMDRIIEASPTKQPFTKLPDFDARTHVLESIAHASGENAFEVLFDTPLSTMREIIPPSVAILEEYGQQTLMRCYTDDAYWLARRLALVEVPYKVVKTSELREALRHLAEDILERVEENQGEDCSSP